MFTDMSGICFRAAFQFVIAAMYGMLDVTCISHDGIECGYEQTSAVDVMFRVKREQLFQRAVEIRRRVGKGLSESRAEFRLEHDFPARKNGIVLAGGIAYGFFRREAAAFQTDGAFLQMTASDDVFQFLPETAVKFLRGHVFSSPRKALSSVLPLVSKRCSAERMQSMLPFAMMPMREASLRAS